MEWVRVGFNILDRNSPAIVRPEPATLSSQARDSKVQFAFDNGTQDKVFRLILRELLEQLWIRPVNNRYAYFT